MSDQELLKKNYPRWITRKDGAVVIVNNPEEHSAAVGYEVGCDAQPVVVPGDTPAWTPVDVPPVDPAPVIVPPAPALPIPDPVGTPAVQPPDIDPNFFKE